MPDLVVKQLWNIGLTTMELRLILMALGGRLKSQDEIEAAKALGDDLSVRRAKQGSHLAAENEKLIASLQEAGAWLE